MNADELARTINELAREISRLREDGPVSVQDVQRMANSLTRSQLVLNALERVEVREHGVSREMAERFIALENAIRKLRWDIYQELKDRRTPAAGEQDAPDGSAAARD